MKASVIFNRMLWTILFALICSVGYAQTRHSLTGTVTDNLNKEPLPGATIRISGSSAGTTTDLDGNFRLDNIMNDEVTLIVTYIGYEEKSIDYSFNEEHDYYVSISLQPTTANLEEVNITDKADGQVKAMIEQQRAANIKNVVSSEQIEQFPDMNAAEVMQRIPGVTLQRDQGEGRYVQLRGTPPELTNFNINGEQIPSPEGGVRYVGMDVISADQIDYIEITKVLTPDMDADGIGGTVNIITKKAESEVPEIRATLAGGYNNLRKTPNYQLQYAYGQRFGNFGMHLNASYYENHQGSDNMEFKYAKGPFWGSQQLGKDNYMIQYKEFQLRHYDIVRTRTGLSATLDYKFSPTSFIYLRGMYNNFTDDETRFRKIYDLDDAVSEKYYLYGGIEHDVKQRKKIQNVSTINLGGEHMLGNTIVDYEISYAKAIEDEPNRLEARFENPGQAISIKFDMSDPDWPRPYFPDPNNSQNAYEWDNYDLDQLLYEETKIEDENVSAKLNLTVPYTFGKLSDGEIKFGAKVRFKEKTRDNSAKSYTAYFRESNIYPGEGPKLSLITLDDGFHVTDLLGHGYEMQYMPDPHKMREFFNMYPQFFIYGGQGATESIEKTYGEDYTAKEDIYAAYFMFRHDFNRLMVLGGLRYERTDIDNQGIMILKTDNGWFEAMDTLRDKRTIEYLLPQIQLKYMLDETTNIRGALSYTYARPNFDDIIPYREQDRDDVKYGNPDLNYSRSMNVDFLGEKYLIKGGILSGGLFYKKIDDFIFYFTRFAHEGDPQNTGLVEITKPVNGNRAFVYGAELQSQFKFTFLPGMLSDFGLFTNYTYTYSEAYIYKRYPANYSEAVVEFGEDDLELFYNTDEEEKIQLPGQARHTANLALFYDLGKFYAKISANYHDAFLVELGADPDLDEYYDEAWHLDFTSNYAINEHLKVFVDLVNLTNAPLKFYVGTPDKIKQQEYYSWWGRVGVKLSF